jgi:hypothetical protein
MLIAVNGTLMKGLSANPILIGAGAKFARDARTAPCYRLWSVGDRHPAMLRDRQGGASISLELWEIDPDKIITVLQQEPPGLVLGQVLLENSDTVLGILAEPYIVEGHLEITHFRGWREYLRAKDSGKA